MKVARVIGNLVAAAQHPAYQAQKIMIVQPEDAAGGPSGPSFVAVDTVQAGPGDRVLVLTEGNGVRQILGKDAGPIRSVIVGIVDAIDAPGSRDYDDAPGSGDYDAAPDRTPDSKPDSTQTGKPRRPRGRAEKK